MTQYAIITNTISKYNDETNKYLTTTELKKLIEAGSEDFDQRDSFSAVYNTLEDAKAVARADEIRKDQDPYFRKTAITSRRIVKLEELA